jgi:hypothetical protein
MTALLGTRVPIQSGRSFKAEWTGRRELVAPRLANETERILENFAQDSGFDPAQPVTVNFRAGIFGHHQHGRAADIYAVGGIGIDEWKARWDRAALLCQNKSDFINCRAISSAEKMRNLGWRLYKALQHYGRWVQPYGFPIQLFGPWTNSEGPWKFISPRLLRAHRDHIHFAI